MRTNKVSNVLLVLVGLFLLSSCKKTVDYEHAPVNLVTEYKVSVSDGYLYGSINNDENTITLYVPFYYELTVVDPEITLSAGARLKNAIVPVAITDTTATYTVTGSDGSIRVYLLNVQVQKIGKLSVNELSAGTSIAEYTPNSTIGVGGLFNTTDINKVHIYLVSKSTQKSIELGSDGTNSYALTVANSVAYVGGLLVTPTLDTGLFYVKVKVYADSVQTQYPIHIIYTQPQLVLIAPTTTVGGTFTVLASNSVITGLTSVTGVINGVNYQFPIVSQTATSFVVSVPSALTAGTYFTTFTVAFSGWTSYVTSANLTIT